MSFFFNLLTGSGFGLLSSLVRQPNNNGQKSVRFTRADSLQSVPLYRGVYNPATSNYVTRDRVSYNTFFDFEALQAVPTGNSDPSAYPNPLQDTVYWKKMVGVELKRDLGNGSAIYTSLTYSNDDLKKWGLTQRVTLGAQSNATIFNSNFTPSTTIIGASSSSITFAASPATYSIALAVGQAPSLFAPISLGAASFSLAVGSSVMNPVFTTIPLPAGQSLVAGDAVKLESTASIFNIVRIITYNSTTGSAYVAVINGVGAGTPSSWTCYKVSLIFASWDTSPADHNFVAHIITYDNGTGAATVRAFAQIGSGTRTPWTVRMGRESGITSGPTAVAIHQQIQVMGQMFLGRYYGDRIVHSSTKRANACGAKYIILEGPNAGSEYTIDLYNSTTVTVQSTLVASGLSLPPVTGYAFIGFMIASPSLGTNANAPIDYNTDIHASTPRSSFIHGIITDTFSINNPIAGGGFSSGEIAFNYKKSGTADTLFWFFDHNLIYGFRQTSPPIYSVDGVAIDTTKINEYSGQFINFSTLFKLNQVGQVFHPNQVSKMADCTLEHGYDSNGLYWKIVLNLSQDWEISIGYKNMIVFPESGGNRWWNKFLSDLGGVFTWPGGITPQPLSGTQIGWVSALFYSTNNSYANNQDYVLAQWRKTNADWGASGNEIGFSGGPKLYPRPYSSTTLSAGTIITVEARQFAGHKGSLVLP